MTTVTSTAATHFDGGRLFVDGRFRKAAHVEPVIEAATGEPLGNGCSATESEIDDAVAAAGAALEGWRATPAAERAAILLRFADALAARSSMTNELCTRENGMPIRLSRGSNGAFPAALLRYYAGLITDIRRGGDPTRDDRAHHRASRTRRRRRGDHAVELPAGARRHEDRARLWLRAARWCSRPLPKRPWTP